MSALKRRVYPAASRYFSHATLAEGKLKDTGDTFRCLFVENTDLMGYMLPRMYREHPIILKKWRLLIPSLRKVVERYSSSIDMCVAVLPLRYEGEFGELAHFRTQTLVCSYIDISCGWEGVRKSLQHNKRQFCNRMDKRPAFSCRISRDPGDFDLFYNEMYVPHITKRFEELAAVDSYDQMRDSFLRGLLLMIEEGDRKIAGVLCEIEDSTLLSRRTGILNGDEEYVRRGASSAEYYFMLKYAMELGLSKVDLLRSRPFVNDGVYGTKRKWGATVYPDGQSESWVFFFIPRRTREVASFFESNPVVVHKDGRLYALVGWSREDLPSAKDEKEFSDRYYSPGLSGLMLIGPRSEDVIHVPFQCA